MLGTITLTQICPHCNKDAAVSVVRHHYHRWIAGELAQHAFPEMKPEDREMLISGIHPQCWEEMYPEED